MADAATSDGSVSTCSTLNVSMGNGTTSNGTGEYTDNGTASDLAKTVEQRIAIIEKALVLQATTGVSHLQKLEKNPAAYGFHKSVRPQMEEIA